MNELIADLLINYDDNSVDKLFDIIDWIDPDSTLEDFKKSEYSGDDLKLPLQLAEFIIAGQLATVEECRNERLKQCQTQSK